MLEMDVRDLACVEKALDALERLHDGEYWSSEPHVGELIRQCLCSEASAWRQARQVTVAWRRSLGLKVRLLDQV